MNRPDISLNGTPFDFDDTVSPIVSSPEAVREMMAHSASGAKPAPLSKRPLHRLAKVRKEQSISLTRVARRLSIDIAEARHQEAETTDLLLSQLYLWRGVLEVPVGELVVEPDEIPGNPIKCRCQLIKMMKTVRTIVENSTEESIVILARLLEDQLIELMPELKSVSAWPSVGQSREQRDFGQALYRRFDASVSRKLDE